MAKSNRPLLIPRQGASRCLCSLAIRAIISPPRWLPFKHHGDTQLGPHDKAARYGLQLAVVDEP